MFPDGLRHSNAVVVGSSLREGRGRCSTRSVVAASAAARAAGIGPAADELPHIVQVFGRTLRSVPAHRRVPVTLRCPSQFERIMVRFLTCTICDAGRSYSVFD